MKSPDVNTRPQMIVLHLKIEKNTMKIAGFGEKISKT